MGGHEAHRLTRCFFPCSGDRTSPPHLACTARSPGGSSEAPISNLGRPRLKGSVDPNLPGAALGLTCRASQLCEFKKEGNGLKSFLAPSPLPAGSPRCACDHSTASAGTPCSFRAHTPWCRARGVPSLGQEFGSRGFCPPDVPRSVWEGDARLPHLSPTQGFGLSVGERKDGGVAAGGSNAGLLIKAVCQQAGGKGRRRATRF